MGTTGETEGNSATGDQFGVGGSAYGVSTGPIIFVPLGYMSNTPLSGTATFLNTTLSDLGLLPGTYKYTWSPAVEPGALVQDGNLTVNVTAPEPAIWRWASLHLASSATGSARRPRSLEDWDTPSE